MKKLLWAIAIGLVLAGLTLDYGPTLTGFEWPSWLSVVDVGPLSQVVVIEESGQRTAAQAAVILGVTSQELRAAGKWRLYDQHAAPASIRPTVDALLATTKPPFVMLFHGDKFSGKAIPLPATDAELAALLQKNGGYQ